MTQAATESDFSRIAARVLNTYSLGEYVSPHWKLQDVMAGSRRTPGNQDLIVGRQVSAKSLARWSGQKLEECYINSED